MAERKVVPFDEFYYQLKLMYLFQTHPVFSYQYVPLSCFWLSRLNVMLQRADVNSSDFKHVNCSEVVGAYYFDTRVGMYLFFLSQIDFL
jgi:hypothetical protein